jgi:hypothetical protein
MVAAEVEVGAAGAAEQVAVLELVVGTVVGTVAGTGMVTAAATVSATVVAMVAATVSVTVMVSTLAITMTPGPASWSATAVGQRSLPPAASIARIRQPDDFLLRHRDGRIHTVG